LKLGVKGFLGTLQHPKTTKSQERAKQQAVAGTPKRLPSLTEKIDQLRAKPNGLELQDLVHSVLLSAGLTSVQKNPDSRDIGVDFVVWSDSLRGSFGNPVLVEVKSHLDKTSFQSAYERLTKQVYESKSGVGVLLYLKRPGQVFERPLPWNPLVLWFDVQEFSVELLHRNLAEVLVERRNLMVHGIAF
jgi:Restriction endonuclease